MHLFFIATIIAAEEINTAIQFFLFENGSPDLNSKQFQRSVKAYTDFLYSSKKWEEKKRNWNFWAAFLIVKIFNVWTLEKIQKSLFNA